MARGRINGFRQHQVRGERERDNKGEKDGKKENKILLSAFQCFSGDRWSSIFL